MSKSKLKVTFGSTVTIAELHIEVTGFSWVFVGESKKHPNDSYNHDIGEAYAVSRAMRNASVLLELIADGKVHDAWLDRKLGKIGK